MRCTNIKEESIGRWQPYIDELDRDVERGEAARAHDASGDEQPAHLGRPEHVDLVPAGDGPHDDELKAVPHRRLLRATQ